MGALVIVIAAVMLMGGGNSRPVVTTTPTPQPTPKPPDAGDVLTTLVNVGVDIYRRYLGKQDSSSSKEH